MIEWRGEGILLSSRAHGETSAIIDVFTPEQGRYAGVVRGGASRKFAPILQPGAQIDVIWKARLQEHIGSFQVEPVRSRAVAAMGDRLALAGLNAVTSLLAFCLPEREPHPLLYRDSEQLLDLLGQSEVWPLAYLRWEMRLLKDMGYALDLDCCAATGRTEELIYVSPKSGRAVSRQGAGDWADRLLPLPPVMRAEGDAPDHEIAEAFKTTGFFLSERLAKDLGDKPLPAARDRFVDTFSRRL